MADAKTWETRVAAWRASGETSSVFSAKHGFAPSTLKYWAWRLRRQESGFVRVVAAAQPLPSLRESPIEIEVASVRIHVCAGFDRATLAQVIELLRDGEAS